MLRRTLFALSLIAAPSLLGAQAAVRHISVVGSVRDSIGDRPLAGATVQLVHTAQITRAWSATTDDRGRFRIDSVEPGEYFVSFFHPAVDSLEIQAPVQRVTLGARDPERIDLGIPRAERVIAALCPGAQPESSAVLVGRVRDPDTGQPVTGATIVARWLDFLVDEEGFRTVPQGVQTTTGQMGTFALCRLPGGGAAAVQALSHPRASGELQVTFEPGSIVRREFTVAEGTRKLAMPDSGAAASRSDTVLRGPGRLTGTVLDESERPVSGAVVELWRTGLSATTDEAGRFELSSLPVGTQSLVVRRIGFAPQQFPVQVASRSPSLTTVVLEKPVRMLDAVRVSATALYSRRQAELERRRRRGWGHFITREDLERSGGSQLSDLLRRVPGVSVYSSPTGNVVVFRRGSTMSGPCRPTVYLDGMRLGDQEDLDFLANVSTLEAVEVYTSSIQAPPEFWGTGCGSLVLWTRTGGGWPDPKEVEPPKEPDPDR
ncbi:MAG: carboxypeptidase regulatory-like domain-containing protein [Gemmatimonadaceae bacterium]